MNIGKNQRKKKMVQIDRCMKNGPEKMGCEVLAW